MSSTSADRFVNVLHEQAEPPRSGAARPTQDLSGARARSRPCCRNRKAAEAEGSLAAGDVVITPPGEIHGIENTGDEDLVYLTVTTPPEDMVKFYGSTGETANG